MKTMATDPHPAAANESGTSSLRGNFVVLRADALRLLLPQCEVGAAEYVADGARAVVALSGRMEPLAQWPADRFVLTRLEGAGRELSFAWNEARVLIDAQLELHPLPAAMRVAGAPIGGYVEHEGELLFSTTARHVIEAAGAGGD